MVIVLFLIFPADGAYRVREQGCNSAISAHETLLPAPSALLAAARDMALGRCALLLLYVAPAAAVVLRLLALLLQLLLLQLLRGCDKNSKGDSRLGG